MQFKNILMTLTTNYIQPIFKQLTVTLTVSVNNPDCGKDLNKMQIDHQMLWKKLQSRMKQFLMC